ncbi:hypothetical protein Taro_040783 [Colocasia esculenta]|uniref:Uncharacterized protein n=1 Tax=Colocasia esculenta TaxID=4460 RepID=A0A843WJQ4_COLES|nr:hypothetical protein [Colocasia esculenta]
MINNKYRITPPLKPTTIGPLDYSRAIVWGRNQIATPRHVAMENLVATGFKNLLRLRTRPNPPSRPGRDGPRCRLPRANVCRSPSTRHAAHMRTINASGQQWECDMQDRHVQNATSILVVFRDSELRGAMGLNSRTSRPQKPAEGPGAHHNDHMLATANTKHRIHMDPKNVRCYITII